MGDWSLIEGQRSATGGMQYATTRGTVVTAGNANVKGDWAEIYASTPFDANGILVFSDPATLNLRWLVDIGVGAGGSEIVLLSNLHVGGPANQVVPFYFPIIIPGGTRIAARCQCTTGASQAQVTTTLLASGFMPTETLGRVTTYGATTADSGGTLVDPGLAAHTKGAYSQINGATSNPIRAMVIAFGNNGNTSMTGCGWLVDIAVGAGGAETIVIADIYLGANTSSDEIVPPTIGPIPIDVPAGTRLAARAQCSIVNGTDRLFDIVLYGID